MVERTEETHARILQRDQATRMGQRSALISHEVTEEGTAPTRRFAVTFAYADGRRLRFDGVEWRTVR